MRRLRILSWVLAVLLLLSAAPVATASSSDVYFTMINNNEPEPLDPLTMPYVYYGEIYVPLSTLSKVGIVGKDYPKGTRLYKSNNAAIYIQFEQDGGTITNEDTRLEITELSRNGTYFYPAQTVCAYFGIDYQLINISPAPIVRLCSEPVSSMNHMSVERNAEQDYNLTGRYEAYMSVYNSAEFGESNSTNTTPSSPGLPSIRPDDGDAQTENGSEYDDGPDQNNDGDAPDDEDSETSREEPAPPSVVSLSFIGLTEDTGRLLDSMKAGGISAGFFVSAEDIQTYPDIIRRIHGEGHQLGIYLQEDPETEYTAASQALFDAVKVRTLLAVTLAEEVSAQAADMGLILVPWTIYAEEMTSATAFLAEQDTGSILVNCTGVEHSILADLTVSLAGSSYQVVNISEII